MENAVQTFPILAFDEPAARIFASIDAALSAAGNRLAVEDLMIAAIALAGGHEIITRDLRSFTRVACRAGVDRSRRVTATVVFALKPR